MPSRLELQYLLEDILGSTNVYNNPPETVRRLYPAIEYAISGIHVSRADDTAYGMTNKYTVTVISKKQEDEVNSKLLKLPMCSLDRPPYIADGLNHYVFTLYY